MKLKSIYLDMPGGYYKKEKYRPHIIEEQFYSTRTDDKETSNAIIKELNSSAGRKVFGFHYDEMYGGIYFQGRTKYDVSDYKTDDETKFFFDFLALTSPIESPGTPLPLNFYRQLVDLFYNEDYQYLNEHTLFFMFENDEFVGKNFSLNPIDEDVENPDRLEESWYSDYEEPEYFDEDDEEDEEDIDFR